MLKKIVCLLLGVAAASALPIDAAVEDDANPTVRGTTFAPVLDQSDRRGRLAHQPWDKYLTARYDRDVTLKSPTTQSTGISLVQLPLSQSFVDVTSVKPSSARSVAAHSVSSAAKADMTHRSSNVGKRK